jgi:PAS domain S-box-containing protein
MITSSNGGESSCPPEKMRERLDIILEAGSLSLWDWNPETGEFWRSSRHDQILGYAEPPLRWTYGLFLEHVLPEDREQADRIIRGSLSSHEAWNLECSIRRGDGEIRWVRIQGKTILSGEDRSVHVVGLMEDITDRRRTSDELRENRQLLQSMLDNAPTAIFFKDRQGRLTFLNKRTERNLHRSRSELLGRTAAQIWPPGISDLIMAREASVLETGKPVEEEEMLEVGGENRWFLTCKFPIRNASNDIIGIGGTSIDITNRKEAEQALREIEERFRIMADSSPLMIWVTDPEGLIQFGNRAYLDFFGTTMEEATGTNWLKFVHPDDKEAYVKAFQQAIRDREHFHSQARLRRADGQWRWIESFGTPRFSEFGDFLGYVGSSPDVTERNRAEEELRRHRVHLEELVRERTAELEESSRKLREEVVERTKAEETIRRSEEQYRLLVSNSFEGIIIMQDGKLRFANPRFLKILGYSEEDLFPLPLEDTIHPDDRERVVDRDRRILSGEEQPGPATFRVIDKEGNTRWVEINGVEISWGGKPATLTFVNDITKRMKALEEKKKVEAQLAQSQKIEALGTFAGGIAHDLNNILYPIIINIELLLSEIDPGTDFHETLKQILSAAYRQRDLVKQILSFSRRREQRYLPVRLTPLLTETLILLRSSLPSSIEVKSHIDAPQDTVTGDPTQIQQVIMNLCRNAADSLENGKGTIEITLSDAHMDPARAGAMLKPGEYAELSVSDTGRGIEPGVMERIFEPFYTTKEVGKGIGMGLPVAHGIVKNHGGMITAESKPGKGTRFTVYLPLSLEKGAEEPVMEEKKTLREARILLVDDEQFILSSMKRALERTGYSVASARNGDEALEIFGRDPGSFDLVITDLTMPGMEGRDLIRRLKGIRPDIPVILSTGYGDTVDEQEMKSIGINELLMKPAGTGELKNAVARAVQKR